MTLEYDGDNIFARILRKEIPSVQVYEDEHTLAIMDIMPRADGHVLIIPKSPVRNLIDASQEQLSQCMASAQKMAKAVMKAFDADGVTLQQFNEAAGGQEIFHLHFHILPRQEGVKLLPGWQQAENKDVLEKNAEKIRQALQSL